ncbi:MAG: sulfatase-like hydrolase/transferase [Sedimentisphaerales bacterium]|nr:sulfatase-like hydrolase/transferase [Sedimentisphaerales bacterium]
MSSKILSRRNFLKSAGLQVAGLSLSRAWGADAKSQERPNILWIVSEDNSTYLGCYGDSYATTDHLDKFSTEGVLYENAFANVPVCAPARSTIISGMYAASLGTHQMRSFNQIPSFVRFFPQYLRDAGYYCTNNAKEDYNMPKPDGAWDESSNQAHYKNRAPGQPFFAIFNIFTSHESSIHESLEHLDHDPAKVTLPPYHPDTPEIRHDWAQYYDKIQKMDQQAGAFLTELEQAGLADDTIVFYYSDHGGVLPRSKRYLYDSGTHVPFIIRFPPRFRHLAPGEPGSRTDRLVSFVDLAPTILSLAGLQPPATMQGEAFLGPYQQPPREYVYFTRDRMDERYDLMRSIRDKRFRYTRNFMPHRIYFQHLQYLWRAPAMRSWQQQYQQGKCNPIQSAYWQPKPPEELYDTLNDPYEVKNLAADPAYQKDLQRMRNALMTWLGQIRDTGFIPEGIMLDRIKDRTAFELVREKEFPLEKIIATADLAAQADSKNLPALQVGLSDNDPSVRYWAATGCTILGSAAQPAIPQLTDCLKDPCATVRIAAAEALITIDQNESALDVITSELTNPNSKTALLAANVLDAIGPAAQPALHQLQTLFKTQQDPYIKDALTYLINKLKK